MQKTKCYLAALVSGVLLVTGILAGCGQSKKDDHLTVYLWENRLMKNIAPYIHEQFPDQDIEFIIGNNDTDLYSYFKEHGELPDIMTVRRFSGTDAQDLQPYLMDFASYDVVSKYYSYAVEYYKDTDNEIQWLPICALPQTIIANKTLFDQYGIKVPENYEEYVQVCQQFYDKGIKPYSMNLAEDWANQEIIQAAAIGEFTSLAGIDWRNEAETSAGEIKFDDVLWKRIFSETSQFLKDSHFSKEDINVNVNAGTQMFVEGKSAMFHGQPRDMQKFQDQMDAELIRIPYFSQTSDSSFFVFVRFLLNRMNTCIEENGEISMEAVVEQIQQTYDMQVSGYYRQLHFVEGYLCKEKKISLETDNNRNFFKAWEKESESTLLFLQENGKAITSDGTKLKVDMPSKLLLNLRNGSNIGKLVALEFEQVKKDGYLVAIPCQEYTINGETYTAIGTVYDHSKLDSMLNLGGYDGSAYLFMLDNDGNITYTNQKDDIFFRNYSLLKHLKIRRSSHEQAKTIPIIAMTANAFSEDMQHSLAAGMNAHISKPVAMKLLKKTIRNIKLGGDEAQFIDQ